MTELRQDDFENIPSIHQNGVDKEEAAEKMMQLVDRMEKWNNQKKASKYRLTIGLSISVLANL